MKRLTLLSILSICLSLLLITCRGDQRSNQERDLDRVILDSLQTKLARIPDQTLIPGFAVSLIYKDSMLFNQGYGYADVAQQIPFTEHTAHTIASISKTFIAVAIMQLVEKGELDLESDINDILPFSITSPHFPEEAIKVKHLVTHSSSINDDFDDGDKRASWLMDPLPENYDLLPAGIKDDIFYYDGQESSLSEFLISFCTPDGKWYDESNFSEFAPGSNFEYSNAGAALAALIVEIVSGVSFSEYTKQNIFELLDMENTTWFFGKPQISYSKMYVESDGKVYEFPRYHEASYPDGQLKTTSTDLTKFHLEMMRGYQGKGALLSPASYAFMFSEQLPREAFDEPSTDKLNDEYAVGVFWGKSAAGYILHTGGMIGVYSILYFNPQSEIGIIAISNLAHPDFGKILGVLEEFETAFEDSVSSD